MDKKKDVLIIGGGISGTEAAKMCSGLQANVTILDTDESKIKEFCSTNYGVTFPMFEKTSVKKSDKQHPLYTWLSNKDLNGWNEQKPTWNFNKYLIDESGNLIGYWASAIDPLSDDILNKIIN